jgi:hypothetical protein
MAAAAMHLRHATQLNQFAPTHRSPAIAIVARRPHQGLRASRANHQVDQ